jgi:hypothetical protein
VWVEAVHFNPQLEDDRLRTLIGPLPNGEQELLAGYRGKRRGLESAAARFSSGAG